MTDSECGYRDDHYTKNAFEPRPNLLKQGVKLGGGNQRYRPRKTCRRHIDRFFPFADIYHLCQNHPFIDGNKRVALASALVFLDINGYQFHCEDGILYGKIMDVAKGEAKKEELIRFFEECSTRK